MMIDDVSEILKKVHNCVAIAYPINPKKRMENNSFYSLSGFSEDYIGIIKSSLSYTNDMKKKYRKVGELIYKKFNYHFTDCHLTDVVKRYVRYYGKKKNIDKYHEYYGKYLSNPICFYDDFLKMRMSNNFERHYSCCEKKILARFNYSVDDVKTLEKEFIPCNDISNYVFKIKYSPCRMCRPPLVGCVNICLDYIDEENIYFIDKNPVSNYSEPLVVKPIKKI